jgi:dihydrolipoamide dehydrogenase
MKKHKIEVIEGTARLEKGQGAPKVVVALQGRRRTGGPGQARDPGDRRPRAHPAADRHGAGRRAIWTYREALVPEVRAEVAGGDRSGAIGIEFASFFRALGSEVR